MNPLLNNPDQVVRVENIARADLILVTDGHADEVGQAVEIAQNTGGSLVASFGLGAAFIDMGVPASQVLRIDPGARFRSGDITVRVVQSVHGSNVSRTTPPNASAGIALSYMITFENGYTLFWAANSTATVDMQIWAERHKPHAVIVRMAPPQEPRDSAMIAALTAKGSPNLKTVMPHHHSPKPTPGDMTPKDLKAALDDLGVKATFIQPEPNQVYLLRK